MTIQQHVRTRCIVAVASGLWCLAAATQLAASQQHSMKTPAGYAHSGTPAELLSYVSLKLKPGWRFDRSLKQFVSAGGQRLSVRDQLPEGSKIVPTAPALAEANPEKLSEAERELARYFQLILPKDAVPERYLRVVKRWDPVDEATLPPRVSLP